LDWIEITERSTDTADGYWSRVPVEITRVAVAEARGQYGKLEQLERLPLEAVTRKLVL
jgi:hypothetical protein